MYVVAVDFEVAPDRAEEFQRLIRENARHSVEREAGCRQFDVCVDPARPHVVFLYELYDDRRAFDAHLTTEHFKKFDSGTADMIARKQIRQLQRIEPPV
jgi:quinol monooxygenase YgiN